jgi:hypothetical protein
MALAHASLCADTTATAATRSTTARRGLSPPPGASGLMFTGVVPSLVVLSGRPGRADTSSGASGSESAPLSPHAALTEVEELRGVRRTRTASPVHKPDRQGVPDVTSARWPLPNAARPPPCSARPPATCCTAPVPLRGEPTKAVREVTKCPGGSVGRTAALRGRSAHHSGPYFRTLATGSDADGAPEQCRPCRLKSLQPSPPRARRSSVYRPRS